MTPLDRLVEFFETLTPASVARIDELYAPDASFKDPFNDVRGRAAIRRVFEHMYEQVGEPRFRIDTRFASDEHAFVAWTFTFRIGARPITVRGATHLGFDADGRVVLHRDYWDVAEELYEKLPVLGVLMRALRRRLAAR